jgi:DNA-binding transcriptional ArsR family regulator
MEATVADVGAAIRAQATFALRMAKLLAVPLRIKILAELNARDMSAKQFYEEFGGGSLTRVSRQFRKLEEYDWIKKVASKSGGKRRGATEHFYRATAPAVFYNDSWAPLPASMKEMVSGRIFEEMGDRITQAMRAGTFDARADRHFTWIPLRLDKAGWNAVIGRIDDVFRFAIEEQEKARARMAKSGEEPIPVTVALAGFESPEDTTKAP